MKVYQRKYTEGSVKPVAKKRRRADGTVIEGSAKWTGTIREGVVREAVDDRGMPIYNRDGSPKLVTEWHTLSKVFSGVDCSKYRGKDNYRGRRDAERAFEAWRDGLIERAEADYEQAKAREEAKRSRELFSYGRMLVPAFMEMYLAERKEDGVEASTLEGYSYSAKYSCDFFAGECVEDVTADALKAFNNNMRKRGLSGTTRNKALKVLKAAFDAHREQIGSYPFADRSAIQRWWPQPNAESPNPLTDESFERVADDLRRTEPTQFMCAVELALRTGMRIGEICGLQWGDVDLDTGRINIVRAIGRTKGGTMTYIKEPKDTGRMGRKVDTHRYIPGTPKQRSLLVRRYRLMAEEVRQARGAECGNLTEAEMRELMRGMYVVGFPDGRYANPTVLGRNWRGYSQNLMGRAGRRPTFHDLRATYVSRQHEADVDWREIGCITGHRSMSVLVRSYSAVSDEKLRQSQLAVDADF